MKTIPLETADPQVHLVEPDIERDAALGVEWLGGDLGRNTLRLMGVTDGNNNPSTLEEERERVHGFITKEDQLNWMIAYGGRVVGSVWVDLEPTQYVPAPAVHIMIGDPEARGKGIGSAAIKAVIDHLKLTGAAHVFSRHLVENAGAAHLLHYLGFTNLGEPYSDKDSLRWQNVSLKTE